MVVYALKNKICFAQTAKSIALTPCDKPCVNAALISKINVIGAYHNALKPMRKEDDAETESLER